MNLSTLLIVGLIGVGAWFILGKPKSIGELQGDISGFIGGNSSSANFGYWGGGYRPWGGFRRHWGHHYGGGFYPSPWANSPHPWAYHHVYDRPWTSFNHLSGGFHEPLDTDYGHPGTNWAEGHISNTPQFY